MTSSFSLVQEVRAHSRDVRGICFLEIGPDRYLLATCSRDKSAKLWEMIDAKIKTPYLAKALGHQGFVTSVLLTPPIETRAMSLFTGGNDGRVNMYTLKLESLSTDMMMSPKFTYIGHTGSVTAIAAFHEQILTVSSDGTLKIWGLYASNPRTIPISEVPLWDVIVLDSDKIAVASADRSISLIRKGTWTVERTLTGHTDCVRSLSLVDRNSFMSAGNDGFVLRWNALTGNSMSTVVSSTSFIFCVTHCTPTNTSVSSGENGNVSVIVDNVIAQKIPHPCQTVWACCFNNAGTLVTGSCDGFIRVFSTDRTKSSETLTKAFIEASIAFASNARYEDYIVQKPDALKRCGGCEGELMVVKDVNGSFLYRWDGSKWNLGKAMVDKGGSNDAGEANDFEFSVDIEDGRPPIKLRFNKNQNPSDVADKFIQENELPVEFKPQIVNFILENTNYSVGSGSADPLTGGSRYVPGTPQTPRIISDLFPLKKYIVMSNVDLAKLEAKILSFDFVKNISKEAISNLTKLGHFGSSPDSEGLALLFEALENWPEDQIYPVLDIVRLALRNEEINSILCEGENARTLLCYVKKCLVSDKSTINPILAVRLVGNMVLHPAGATFVKRNGEEILSMALDRLRAAYNSKLEIATATLLANMALLLKLSGDKESCNRVKSMTCDYLDIFKVSEGQSRVLVALGTMCMAMDNPTLGGPVRSMVSEWSTITRRADAESSHSVSDYAKALLQSFD